jgi:hypothetical protein
MRTAKQALGTLKSVADDPAPAVITFWSRSRNRALKALERVMVVA